jgi:DNA polymerase phi
MHEIEKLCGKDSNVGFGLIAQLVGKYGNQKFDKAIRTKMIDTMLASMDVAGIKSYISFLSKCFVAPEDRLGISNCLGTSYLQAAIY